MESTVTDFPDAVDENYNTNIIEISATSDDAQLQDENVDTVNQTDIENESITDDRIASAEQLLTMGRSYQREGRSEEAICKSYEEGIQIANETDHDNIKSKTYQHLGNVFTGTSEYKKAIEYYQKARKISPDLEGDEIEVIAYQWLGYNHLQTGQYQESIEYYNEVIKLASQLGCETREVNASIGLGSAFSYIGDFKSSEEYFLKAITMAKQLRHEGVERIAHTNLGHVQYKSCQFDAAIKSYLKTQEISLDLGDRKEEANACLILGDTFQQLKQHQKALNINKELKDKEVQANAVQRLGSISFNIGEYEEALKYSKILVKLIQEPDYRGIKQALAQKRLGMCYAYLGRFEEGLTCFKKGFEISLDQEAITFYEKTKTIAKQVGKKYEEYRSNQAIGNILSNTGDYLKAKEYYEQAMDIALELSDKHCEATSCLNLASVCSKDYDYDMAMKWYEKVLDILGAEPNDHLLYEKALTGLGVTLVNLGDTKKAIKLIQEAQTFAKNKNDTGH
ncbi:tetratricopeptide repeat [Paramuricea clavata]|uniref:Tetratricopeptide repeat n=1 Tax=Paramuricea clavata TaxID=317549 RepID=A0A6S7K3G6_PARCT|nr:tetratricopeptide repeat [Paramuricea clavata]